MKRLLNLVKMGVLGLLIGLGFGGSMLPLNSIEVNILQINLETKYNSRGI